MVGKEQRITRKCADRTFCEQEDITAKKVKDGRIRMFSCIHRSVCVNQGISGPNFSQVKSFYLETRAGPDTTASRLHASG